MLPAYGVLVGTYTTYSREQGQWLHVDMNVRAGDVTYQAAVDVNEPTQAFQYQILDNLSMSLFSPIAGKATGWHPLAPNASSGAIDYARSPLLTVAMGAWTSVTGDEAGNALVAMLEDAQKVFVFGAPYVTGHGVHDVHCNQGDPPGPHQADDGIWQDGCVLAIRSNGSLSAYLGKFSTQTLDTNDQGVPL